MNSAPRSATILAALISAAAFASAQSAPLSDLPGFGKPKRSGYTITVEGGEEGPKSVYYEAGESKPARTRPLPVPVPAPLPARLPGPLPAPVPNGAPAPANAGNRPAAKGESRTLTDASGKPLPFQFVNEKPLAEEEIESPVNRFTQREENASQRRFDRNSSEYFEKGQKYDTHDPVTFGRWGRGGDTYEKESAPGVSFSNRFDTGESFEKKTMPYDRRDREVYARGGDKAEIPAWTERFSRDKNSKFSDRENGSSLREKLAQGYSLLTQVSMQDINRNNFRRNHSSEKGDLPVGKIGAEGVKPMKPSTGR